MKITIKNCFQFFIFLMLISLLSCHDQTATKKETALKYFIVGFATPSGNKIWVQKAEFDQRWWRPAGSMACCWEEAGKTSGVDNQPLPHEVYIQWLDESENLVYAANVTLPPDLPERARKLPDFVWKRDGKHDRDVYIIIGMKEHGEVVVWLSNAPHGENMTSRVLEIIGQAQAKGTPWTPPKDSETKNVKHGSKS